jgi:cell wall-associated NlpC family hydrolase
MNGVLAVQARIAELEGQFRAIVPAPARTNTVQGTSTTAFGPVLQGAVSATAAASPAEPSRPSGGAATGPDLVAAAKKYLGVPYRWGGTNPATGLDCSALVQRALGELGVKAPRVVAQQRHIGTEVPSLDQARPGDLIVLGGSRHIGIYVGDGKMLHAPRTGDVVKIGKVYETPTSIRRVLPAAPAAAGGGLDATAVRPPSLQPAASSGGISGAVNRFGSLFASATARYGLPDGLLAAVAQTESAGNPSAVSPAGARGLMQIMPGTARELRVNPNDPAQAVDGAARLLSDHLKSFGSLELALAAYNAGPGAVRKYGGIPPYRETQAYVRKVTALMPGERR